MSRLPALCLAGTLSLIAAAPVHGAGLKGLENPKFQSALHVWVEGKDDEALHAFAALARAENRAAQVFLGRVASEPWLHAHLTDGLARKERIELLRKPGGLSGKSWLYSAAADTALAQQFLDADKPYQTAENGKALLAEGELDAALPLMTRAWNAGDLAGAFEVALTDKAMPYSSGLVQIMAREIPTWAEWKHVSLSDPRMVEIRHRLDQLPKSDPAGEFLWGNAKFIVNPNAVSLSSAELRSKGAMLMGVPEMQPIIGIVRKHCPQEVAEALTALQMGSYGYPLTLTTFSPVETVLPTAEYRKSARFEADVLRHILHVGSRVIVQKLDKCAYFMLMQ